MQYIIIPNWGTNRGPLTCQTDALQLRYVTCLFLHVVFDKFTIVYLRFSHTLWYRGKLNHISRAEPFSYKPCTTYKKKCAIMRNRGAFQMVWVLSLTANLSLQLASMALQPVSCMTLLLNPQDRFYLDVAYMKQHMHSIHNRWFISANKCISLHGMTAEHVYDTCIWNVNLFYHLNSFSVC